MPNKKRINGGPGSVPAPSIAATVIATGDRKPHLEKLLPQLAKLDQVILVDTSSAPDIGLQMLVKKLRKPFEYHHLAWRPSSEGYDLNEWGFAYARNFSFSQIRTSHAIWLDSDDLIGSVIGGVATPASPGQVDRALRRIITEAPPDVDLWFLDYVYDTMENGEIAAMHGRERIVKMECGWSWVYPIHEVMVAGREAKPAYITDVKIIHYPERAGRDNDRNLDYLQQWLSQLVAMGDDAPTYELARCRMQIGYHFHSQGQWQAAADWLHEEFLVKHPESHFLAIWQTWVFIAKAYMELGKFGEAKMAALKAVDLQPGQSDGYIQLALAKLKLDEDPRDILKLMECTAHADDSPQEVITNPLDYTFLPWCIMADCKYRLGRYNEAFTLINKALAKMPNDGMAQELFTKIYWEVRKQEAQEAAATLYQTLHDFEESEKAAQLFEVLPYFTQQDEAVREIALKVKYRTRHLFGVDRDKNYQEMYERNRHWEPADEQDVLDARIRGAERLDYIVRRLQAKPGIKRILDVGCSDGFMPLILADMGYEVVGVDLDQRCVDLANERAEKWGRSAKFMKMFFEKIDPAKEHDPFDGEPFEYHFDAVIAGEILEHVQEPQMFLDTLADCAKDGAPIILTTPNGTFDRGLLPQQDDDYAGHVRVYTRETLEALLALNPDYFVTSCEALERIEPLYEGQGWVCGEIRRMPRPNGPIIRIVCGNATSFNPDSLWKEGCGGSETAVIHMARAWASVGCQVVVYGAQEGIWDGVFYRSIVDWRPEHKSDVLVAWRLPQLFTDERPNAAVTVLWAHDLWYPAGFTPEMAERIDRVAVLSEFHKEYFYKRHPEFLGTDKLWVTRNGIEAKRFAKPIEKIGQRYIYSSSYDRGLQPLLEEWKALKELEEYKDAELHVAYGLDTARTLLTAIGDFQQLRGLEQLAEKIRTIPGVVHHERLSQEELAELQMSCEAWLYPPHHFLETYCITALEAQAAGCVPISRLNGALPETLNKCIEWKEGDKLADLLDQAKSFEHIEENRQWALTQTWAGLAFEWLKELAPKPKTNEG